ncbi:DUF1796 family putative cysteine peptidase [Neoroseomonas alba]|uniref:DUF1796 family putative cysteine peptidase n=1 Tax=Roseomonas alba TaxID=2846776 RepID=UPI001C931B69
MTIQPLSSFRHACVDHIVSLGTACETAYNLRRHYDFATAYPFDWWISGTGGVAHLIRDGAAADLYRVEDLEAWNGGAAIRNTRYDIRLHHEFPRDWRAPGQPVAAGWTEHVATPRRRTAHLTRRFFGLAGTARSVVFFRMFGQADSSEADTLALLNALQHRFAAVPTGVVFVNHRGPSPGNWPIEHITVGRRGDWRGDSGAWDAALSSLRLRLTPGLHRALGPQDLRVQAAATMIPEVEHAIDPPAESVGGHSHPPERPISIEG